MQMLQLHSWQYFKVLHGVFQLVALSVSILLICIANPLQAQTQWPSKPITIIVPFPPGGATDALARAVANRLGPALGQPVVIDYKPGAGATLGAAIAAKAPADGYTLLMGAVHHTSAANVYKNLSYDFQNDFTPITIVGVVPNVLVVNANKPIYSVKELIAQAKSEPNKLSYGSNGNGTAQHLIGAQFQMLTNTQLLHIPYKGSAPLTTDLLGGQIDMSFDATTSTLPHIKAGKLRPLAVITPKRSTFLPGVPTLSEAGVPGINITTWFGLLAPAATPKPITKQLHSALMKIIQTPEFKAQLEEVGAEPIGNSQEEMAKQIADEMEKFNFIVRTEKITIN
jgi:tripartite-type tricarboxylate transporter receptor subunit TctC